MINLKVFGNPPTPALSECVSRISNFLGKIDDEQEAEVRLYTFKDCQGLHLQIHMQFMGELNSCKFLLVCIQRTPTSEFEFVS